MMLLGAVAMGLALGLAVGWLAGEHTAAGRLLVELDTTEQRLHDCRNELLAVTLKLRKYE